MHFAPFQHVLHLTAAVVLFGTTLASTGCHIAHPDHRELVMPILEEGAVLEEATLDDIPKELNKAILPTYTIEPPDILLIDAIHVVPKTPYVLKTLDSLEIQVQGTLPDAPIGGIYQIGPGGQVNLGFSYGSLDVTGMTPEEVEEALTKQLKETLNTPVVNVSLAELAAQQQIIGEHLVGPDGTVTLGTYGSVQVVGMTIAEAKLAVEEHLSQFLDSPEISVDVFAYNSKVYYVITQGAGRGDRVYRFPITGNETVLDAIAQVNGLEQVSSKNIWIARAGRNRRGRHQILPIDWNGITQYGEIDTNYQILPSDRVYVAEDKLIAFDTGIGKLISPLERIVGFTLLGTGMVTRLSGPVLRGGGNRQGNF